MRKQLVMWAFLKTVAPQISLSFTNDGSQYAMGENHIYYDFDLTSVDVIYAHIKYVHKYTDINYVNPYLFIMLHEIGHHYTEHIKGNDFLRQMLSMAEPNDVNEYIQIALQYMNMPDEYAATGWAIHFIKHHIPLIKKFNKLLRSCE